MSFFNHFIKLNISVNRLKAHIARTLIFSLVALVGALLTFTVVRAAPTILATLTYTFIGGDGDGKADPGETIEYTAVVQNSGTDATGVTFNDIIDLNTTLVGGSINVSPLAADDSYDTIGNTLLEVGVTASGNPAVTLAGGLFGNDTEFLSDTFTLKSVESTNFVAVSVTSATESGGSVTVEGDGNFSYTPPVGFSGADHFDYVITDDGPDNVLGNADDLTGAGRVTINVTTQRVWYVKNDAAAGDGHSSNPFNTLAAAQTASAANDTIYVFAGSGTTSGQNAGIVLKNGQRLLGEGVALTVPVSVNGGANPTTLRVAGSQPQIDNTTVGGNGVSVTDLSNVEIRGLNIAGNTNAIDVTTTAANSGSFEIANNTIRAAGVEGIDINGGGSDTLTVSLHDNTVTATGNGIDIQRTAGSVNITAFDDNVVTGNSLAIGINVVGTGASILFDTTPGTAAFDTVLGGTTTIGQSGNGVGLSGLVLSNIRGDLSFTDLDIYADGGNALFVNGTSPNYTGTSGTRVTANTGAPTLSATGGAAADLTDVSVNLVLSSMTSSSSSATGVSLLRVGGTFTAPSGSTITNSTGADFSINGGSNANANVTVTYPGTITDDVGTLVQVQNVTAASTQTFSGAITDGNDGDGSGISLTNNSGATITFSGGLLLSTGSNAAFTATGGGTINICDENPCNPGATGALVNTFTTTTGTALNVANTNIGANKLEFRSVSSSGAANGIVLDTTGASGGLVVNGTGSSGTGGTIQNSTGDGVRLISTTGATLKYMNITGSGNSGVRAELSTNVSLQNLSVTSNSNAASNCTEAAQATCEAGIYFVNMLGLSNAISNTTVSGSFEDNIHVQNFNSNVLGNLAISNCTVTNNNTTSGNVGIHIMSTETSSITASITNCLLQGNRTDSINTDAGDSSTLDITISGNTIVAGTGGNNQGNLGIDVTSAGTTNVTFHVVNNKVGTPDNGTTKQPLINTGINIFRGASAGTMSGLVTGNTIIQDQTLANTNPGSGIVVNHAPTTTSSTSALFAKVDGNQVGGSGNASGTGNGNYGILIDSGGVTNATGSTQVQLTNNVVATGSATVPAQGSTALDAIRVNSRRSTNACYRISGNSASTAGAGFFAFYLRKDTAGVPVSTMNIEGLALGTQSDTTTKTYIGSTNTIGGPGVGATAGNIYTGMGAGTCSNIPIASLPGSQTMANTQPSDNVTQAITSVNDAKTLSSDLNSVNAFVAASAPIKLSKQTSGINSHTEVVTAAINSGGKPLFSVSQPAPAQSGETVNVTIGSLPAGKSVTIKYRVTVNDPLTVGVTQISNQGTFSGSNFSNVLTDDPSVGGASDPTITPIDRPDTTVSSINRAASSPTNAASVSWTVTFADAVSGLTSSNFTLVNSGLGGTPAITGVTAVGGAPATQWTVTASTGSGDGTLGLNMTSDAGLSHDVTNGNTVTSFTGQVYTIDRTAPTVSSIKRQSPSSSLTNADALVFRVTFNEAVTSVGAGSFVVTGTTTTITNVASVTPNLVFDLTLNGTVNGDLSNLNGTVGLDVTSSPIIKDLAGNTLQVVEPTPAATNDQTYTLDNTAPSVTSFTLKTPATSPTNADTLVFLATFSEAVTGVDTADFAVNSTTTATVTNVSPVTTSTYDVTVSGGDLASYNGTVNLNLSGTPTIVDQISNALPTGEPSIDQTYTLNNTAPSATSFTVKTPATASTNADSLTFLATFSEAVTGVDTADFAVNSTTTATVTNVTPVTTSTYDVTISGGDLANFNGTVNLNLSAAPTILNLASNALVAAEPSTDDTYTVDNVAPNTSITTNPTNPTNSTSPSFSFSGSDAGGSGVASFQCDLDGGGFSACVSPKSYAGLSNGNHTFQVRAVDNAGNTDATPASFTWVVDATAPDTTITNNPFPTGLTNNTSATFNFTGNDGAGTGVASFECKLDSGSFAVCTSGINYNSLIDGSHTFQVRAIDNVGNADATPASYTWTVDTTGPTVVVSSVTTSPTNVSPITVTITFNEPVTGFTPSVAAGDIVIGGVGGVDSNPQTISSTVYTFDLAPSGQGAVTVKVPASSASDAAANFNAISNTFSITYDTVGPAVTINQAAGQGDPTGTSPINFTVVFNESVTGFIGTDVNLSGTANPTTAMVTGSGTTYNVAVSGMNTSGTVIASIPTGVAQDAAANTNAASTSTDSTVNYNYDNIPPTVVSSLRADPSPTSTVNVNFTVTFSEPVTGVDVSDFSLTTSGVSNALVTGVSGSGSVYTVTVNAGSNNGTIRLDVLNNNTIKDAVLNSLGAGFTGGESYTIISKSPIFADVPYSYWANGYVERLYNAGITGGCATNPLVYCPDEKVTRAQMAVFILRAMHGSTYSPPPATGTVFGDVPITYWAAAWIEQFYAEGVTAGCGNGNYCPDQVSTTRAQMAVFLLRAKHGSAFVPPAPTGVFNDVPTDYWAAAWIEQLAAEGITSGCGGGNYCPENSLTRAEMAVFLVKTLNFPK